MSNIIKLFAEDKDNTFDRRLLSVTERDLEYVRDSILRSLKKLKAAVEQMKESHSYLDLVCKTDRKTQEKKS